jgi:hypothetical protein
MKEILVETPSELLAKIIFTVLLEKGIILGGDVKKNQHNLALGKLKSEDWRLLIEKSLDKRNMYGE